MTKVTLNKILNCYARKLENATLHNELLRANKLLNLMLTDNTRINVTFTNYKSRVFKLLYSHNNKW